MKAVLQLRMPTHQVQIQVSLQSLKNFTTLGNSIIKGNSMNELTPIQKEIVTALEQMKEKSLITEANLTKKVRENAKISGKNKAGICLKDLEVCIEYLGENNQLPYALHLNSANDILIKKEESWKVLDGDAKKRRQSSEKSISVLTNGDLRQKASGGKGLQKRNDRKRMSLRDVEEFE